jgi:hypothetical protein
MEKFNKMLVDCVFFAMPQVLIFFPRYQVSEEKPDQRLSLMAIIQHTNNQSNEKVAVVLKLHTQNIKPLHPFYCFIVRQPFLLESTIIDLLHLGAISYSPSTQ